MRYMFPFTSKQSQSLSFYRLSRARSPKSRSASVKLPARHLWKVLELNAQLAAKTQAEAAAAAASAQEVQALREAHAEQVMRLEADAAAALEEALKVAAAETSHAAAEAEAEHREAYVCEHTKKKPMTLFSR